MTRALVIQMLDCLVKLSEQSDCDIDPFTFGRYGGNSAVTAAREYLATEPSGERAELIAQLRDAHGRRFDTSPPPYSRAADMLEADADLRTQLARRTVERNMAISMAISMLEADAQQANKPTGWDNGLSQDYCAEFGQWLASRPGARQQIKAMFGAADESEDLK